MSKEINGVGCESGVEVLQALIHAVSERPIVAKKAVSRIVPEDSL